MYKIKEEHVQCIRKLKIRKLNKTIIAQGRNAVGPSQGKYLGFEMGKGGREKLKFGSPRWPNGFHLAPLSRYLRREGALRERGQWPR